MRQVLTGLAVAATMTIGLAGAASAASAPATNAADAIAASTTVPAAYAQWHGRHHGWGHRHWRRPHWHRRHRW